MDPDVARQVLASDAGTDAVRADEQAANELGITGVPHFVLNGKWAVPGAQDVETLLRALDRAWARTEAVR
jgi:predicted DsbA family dithiol-disulfide isomerase